ncbi:L-threonylcarbamoyladenylate synthase [Synechococcus sp. PCC 7336]|uniref:L-threonylcarbamoyladenylate synthase n=1 Tax=Synechococcus sp. PCC 7336 TaxID=195250 RepID=UPI00034D514C|nr:L-threonylcarbamoyladenylate synthase [Synechococcus sp. PCC 7336]
MLVDRDGVIAAALRGEVVSFPTDTVPALAALPERANAIYQLKQRPSHKPLILMGATVESLKPYIAGWESAWQAEIERAWPGPLTLVLPVNPEASVETMISEGKTLGIRIPASTLALDVLRRTGPLATTSANESGQAPLTNPAAIADRFPTVAVLDAASPQIGLPSTVALWRGDLQNWEILRQGHYRLSVSPF